MADSEGQKSSLAFSFAKKKVVQKVAVNVEERKDAGQLITGFDGARAQVVGGDTGDSKTYVIPKLENTFKTGVGPKKFTPTFKPPSNDAVKVQDGEDKFVQAASTVPVITEYGLQLRDVKSEDRAKAGAASNGAAKNAAAAALEERALREAVEELPDVADEEAYEAMPVEEFGRAMLRGMGWEEGMGVGRNRQKVDAIEYVRRPERLGLGAQPVKLAEDPKKLVKMGDKPKRQDLVLAPDADGRQRNIRTLDEKLVPRSAVQPGPQPGKAMRITGGPHAGLACTALEALPGVEGRPDRWRVRLAASQEEVDVPASDLGERWEKEPPPPTGGARQQQQRAEAEAEPLRERSDRERGRSGDRDERKREGSREGEGARRSSRRAGQPSDEEDQRAEDARQQRRRERGSDYDRGRESAEREADRERNRERARGRTPGHRGGKEDGDGAAGGGGGKRGLSRDRDEREEREESRHGKKHKHHEKKHRHKHHKDRGHPDEEEEEGDTKQRKDKHKDKHKGKHKHKHDRDALGSSSEDEEEDGGGGGDQRRSGPTWLFPHIKVRIVDKRVRSGKLYLKKGTVVDVHPGGTADVAVDDTGDVLRLAESSLETVVPKHQGAAVLVVAGPHRGARGRLLQANTAAGAAAVQLAADFSIVRLLLDDVAGYAGELEEE